MEINKELIKNVLVEETENLSDDFTFDIKDNYILFADEGECQFEVNIYEFSHKNCKEWALNKGSYINCFYNEFWWDRVEKKYTADIPNKNKSFYADTEIEAIIKACNWVLENSK